MTQTVVITGASAGIARATARLYGARGARLGLIAGPQSSAAPSAAEPPAGEGSAAWPARKSSSTRR